MALGAYLTLTASRHGPIRGSVTQRGREGKILLVGVSHGIVCPRDPTNGRPTGKRMHKPLVATKPLDASSPLLYAILTSNENISEARVEFWAPSPTGQEKQHFTITLTNATISSIAFKMPNNKNVKLAKFVEYEEVAFTYQKIEWRWTDGGISADDDWETPR